MALSNYYFQLLFNSGKIEEFGAMEGFVFQLFTEYFYVAKLNIGLRSLMRLIAYLVADMKVTVMQAKL